MSEVQSVTDEIVRLHDFFQDWFNGDGDRSINEFSDALDDDFYIVSPTGTEIDKAQVVGFVEARALSGPVEIDIRNVRLKRNQPGGIQIATYEEHQRRPNESVGIISSVSLATDDSRPGGFRWQFVHETFLSPTGSSKL